MKGMRIAICDDEKAERELIIKYLQEWADSHKMHVDTRGFSDAETFLFHWEEDKGFELLILDIEMGQLNGMELAQRIRQEDEEIPILFITGYESYMSQGYEVSAIQYLLKPMYKEKLFTALDKLQKSRKKEEKMAFQTEEGMLFLPPSAICYLEARGHYSVLHTLEKDYEIRHSFSEMLKKLEKYREFKQCHRSYLVNLKYVSAIMKTELVLDKGERIPISRNSYKKVNQSFIASYGLGTATE